MASPEHSVRWLPEAGGWRRFELTSRGDRIVARLRGAGDGAAPLALVLADDADAVAPVPGCATLTLDLPLLGARSSPKWTERLQRVLAEGPVAAADGLLLTDFVDQAVADVAAALDVCAGLGEAGPRAGLLGVGPGAWVAASVAEREPRLSAFVIEPSGLALALDAAAAFPEGGCTVAGNAGEGSASLSEALGA